MANNFVTLPLQYYPDPNKGGPLFNGSVFIGQPNLDPEIEANRQQVTLRQQDGTEVIIAPSGQPLRIGSGGLIEYQGSAVEVLTDGNYSIKALNRLGVQAYYLPNAFNGVPVTLDQVYLKANTVADMVANTSLSIGDLIITAGYFSVGDGGGNTYEVVAAATGTPDGGSFINLTGTSLQAKGLFPNDVINVKQFGARGDGITSDSLAIVAAGAFLQDYGTLLFSQGNYLAEATEDDPNGGAFNSVGILFTDKTGLTIIMEGATICQETTDSTTGYFMFNNCNDCRVTGKIKGRFEGGVTTNALASAVGACNGITVEGDARGGRALFTARSLDGTASGTRPGNTVVNGNVSGCEYGINYTHCDRNHVFNINVQDGLRGVFITGSSGINGKINGQRLSGSGLNISTRDGDTIRDVVVEANFISVVDGINIGVSDATACNIRNILITGECQYDGSFGGATSVSMLLMGNVSTLIRDINLSDFRIIQTNDSTPMIIQPDLAATISNIRLPDIFMSGNANLLVIDNTANATITDIEKVGGRMEYAGAVPANVISVNSTGGTVSNMRFLDVEFPTNTPGGLALNIRNADGLTIDGCNTDKEILVLDSINVKPGVNSQLGRNFVHEAAISSGFTVSWMESMIVTTGAAVINNFGRAIPGQRLTLMFTSGTQTLNDGANLILDGNFVATAGDSIDLVCVDSPANGPLATSTFQEVSRSVN